MLVICKDTKQRLQSNGKSSDGDVLVAVSDDIENLLQGKDYDALVALQARVDALFSGDTIIDVDFWTALKEELLIRKAKAKLEKIHAQIIKERVSMLKETEKTAATESLIHLQVSLKDKPIDIAVSYSAEMDQAQSSKGLTNVTSMADFKTKLDLERKSVERIGFIPLKAGQSNISGNSQQSANETSASDRLFEKEASKAVNENEEVFDNEADLGITQDKRIKPKYFNRVQMGFDWNKYNQTHFNADHPPPKTVQGYKFNIFYPELADSSKAPTYKIIRDKVKKSDEEVAAGGEVNTCLIKFIAGEPYQDIAFRIVDKEWNYSSKKDIGFKSSFDKGILQLHFRFKKIFYRK